MKSKGKFVLLVVVIISLLTTAGFGNTVHAQDKVELRYALWDSNQQPAYQACADEFTKRNPNITISIEQAGWSEYWDGLTTSLVSGTAPDVFTNHIGHYPELLNKGQILDIQPFVDADKIDTSVYLVDPNLLVKDGKRYGLPQDWDTIGIFFNKDMLDKAKVTEKELSEATWNPKDGGSFQEIIARLTLDANGKNGLDKDFDKNNVVQWGFAGGPGDASSGGQPDWSGFAASTGFQLTDKPWGSKYNLDDANLIATLEWWADLHLDKGYAPGTEQISSGIDSLFLAGKVAMYTMGSWAVGGTKDATFKVGFAPLPEGPKGRRSPINGLSPAIYSGTKHPKEAWQWVKFLTSADCANIVGDHGVVFPAIQSGVDRAVEAFDKKGLDVSAFTSEASAKGGTYLLPMTDHGTEIRDMLQPVLQDIFDGKQKAADALPTISTQINDLFK